MKYKFTKWQKVITCLSGYDVGSLLNTNSVRKKIKCKQSIEIMKTISRYLNYLYLMGFLRYSDRKEMYLVSEQIPSTLNLKETTEWVFKYCNRISDSTISGMMKNLDISTELQKIKNRGLNKMSFSQDELSNIQSALNRTWQTIGGDVIEANNGKSISRAEVIEVVLDANYLDLNGKLDKELLKKFQSLSYKKRCKIAKETFTYSKYGM